MSKVAIVGAGFIGRAWAISFARAGHTVAMWDGDESAPGKALSYIEKLLPDLEGLDLLNGDTATLVRNRMSAVDRLEDALGGADYVQENTPEQLDIKRAVFAELDALASSDAILASSTSAILPSAFTEHLAGRARCLVVHPLNPPYLIPAAEVVPAPWTSASVVTRASDILRAAGHAPIVMKHELDGFVMNRLQGALLEEAFRLVAGGHASVEDVDIGIREGLALRWSFMGPFECIDLNAPGGVRDYVERYESIYKRLHAEMQTRADWSGPVLKEIEEERRKRLPAGKLADRQAWRDRRLMALAAHKRRMAEELPQ